VIIPIKIEYDNPQDTHNMYKLVTENIPIPDDITMRIVYSALTNTRESVVTLSAMSMICKAFNRLITLYHKDIVERYTKISTAEGKTIYLVVYTERMICPH
jgi:hypothetical protein